MLKRRPGLEHGRLRGLQEPVSTQAAKRKRCVFEQRVTLGRVGKEKEKGIEEEKEGLFVVLEKEK